MKNKLIYFIFILFSLIVVKIYFLPIYEPFDIKLRELMFKIHEPQKASDSIVIIDIDTNTINTLGQWPFSRLKIAQVLQNLSQSGAGIIGMDIVFSSPDRSSPHLMAKELGIKGNYINSDEQFAQIISSTPTILGYFYDFKNTNNQKVPSSPAIFSKINFSGQNSLVEAKGVNANIEPIASASYSSGFFNIIGLQSGLIDKAALLLTYEQNIYPSLAFEMVRIASQSDEVSLFYNTKGLDGIRLKTGDIKTDLQAGIFLNYRGPSHSYKYISFLDIYNGNFNPKDVEGKFVLIGTSDIGLHDIVPSLYDSSLPGVEVHATVIDNLLNSDYLYAPLNQSLVELILLILGSLVLAFLYSFISARLTFLVSFLVFFGALYLNYWLMFETFRVYNFFLPLLSIVLTTLLFSLNAYYNEQKQKIHIKNSFSKKVSEAVVEEILLQDKDTLKSQKREISIFFSDIRNFTKTAEKLQDPQILIDFLNTYLDPMSKAIVQSKGTIDKFIGDAIMAYWNAPLELKNHADIAVTCAIKQLNVLEYLNLHLKKEFGETVEIGIGINTDEVIVAEIGSLGRSDYTIIGDGVNLASRCEGLCKFYGVNIIITESTKNRLKQKLNIRELDTIKVVGKDEAITIFEVSHKLEENLSEEYKKYHLALELYKNAQFKEALLAFKDLENQESSRLYKIYITRCQDFIQNKPLNFDGIYQAKTK